MRSPLFGILGMLDLMKDALTKRPEKCMGYVESTLATTHELTEMVNSLLDISRLEEGKMPINVSQCNIEYLINQATKLLSIDHSDIELKIEMLTDHPDIYCDSGLIRRVLQNLLSNAVKFSHMGGKIIVRVERPDDYIRVSVIDNGPGIPAEFHTKIFEKFGQVNSRTNNRKYSTGLGLAFCKLVIKSHQGDIGVYSVPDEGSNFWFTINDNHETIGLSEI
jgi:signal transduction histidine kinase